MPIDIAGDSRGVGRGPRWSALAAASRALEAEYTPERRPGVELLLEGRFDFLGVQRVLPEIGWTADYPDALLAAVLRLKSDPGAREEMGNAGAQRVHYDRPSIAAR